MLVRYFENLYMGEPIKWYYIRVYVHVRYVCIYIH